MKYKVKELLIRKSNANAAKECVSSLKYVNGNALSRQQVIDEDDAEKIADVIEEYCDFLDAIIESAEVNF